MIAVNAGNSNVHCGFIFTTRFSHCWALHVVYKQKAGPCYFATNNADTHRKHWKLEQNVVSFTFHFKKLSLQTQLKIPPTGPNTFTISGVYH